MHEKASPLSSALIFAAVLACLCPVDTNLSFVGACLYPVDACIQIFPACSDRLHRHSIQGGKGVPILTGVCRMVFQELAHVPVLGICLGLQALATAHGAAVSHAPYPVHGRLSAVRHGGDGLFAGIPAGELVPNKCFTASCRGTMQCIGLFYVPSIITLN